jgi:deoxyribonuclease V
MVRGRQKSSIQHQEKSMKIQQLHNWNLSPAEAIALQQRLRGKVEQVALESWPKIIAGLDCALSKDGQRIVAAVVVLRGPQLVIRESSIEHQASSIEIVETTYAVQKVSFPYIPGLLSFRESPACLTAVEKLKCEPDVFIIDGQGIAHPRRFGIASHLGLFFDKPTIGCAKSRLIGSFEEPQPQKGSYSLLKDKNEIIGAAVRTRTNVELIFVSVGNKCLLQDAIEITLAYTTKYRIPEPTRLAHQIVSELRLKA